MAEPALNGGEGWSGRGPSRRRRRPGWRTRRGWRLRPGPTARRPGRRAGRAGGGGRRGVGATETPAGVAGRGWLGSAVAAVTGGAAVTGSVGAWAAPAGGWAAPVGG